jgi:hypothetical protein
MVHAMTSGRGGAEMVGRSFAGVMLVAIGVALLLIELTGVGRVAIVLLGGLAFLATHLATRSYGFLVPGGILTGFGAALVAEDLGVVTDIGLLGLGAGFLLIPAVQLLTGAERPSGWWWPLIPGGILVLLGSLDKLDGRAAGLILPGLLIILGLGFLLAAARSGPQTLAAGHLDDPAAAPGADPEGPEGPDPRLPEAR